MHPEVTIEISLDLEDGSYIILGTDDHGYSDGAALILNKDDESIGLLSTPQFSAESNINIKKAELKDDTTVSLLIEANQLGESADMIFKLTSTWYNDYFSGGSWIIRNGDEVSLSLTHKPFLLSGSTNERILKQADSWNKVKTRHSPSHRWYNEQGLSDQYACHYGYARNKNPWNLEPWRPDVGLTRTILASCNPEP